MPRATVNFSVSATDGMDTVKVTGDDRIVFVDRYEYLSIELEGIITEFTLHENYPNPFNGHTNFVFQLQHDSSVDLSIFDLKGNLIKKIINDFKQSGNHKINWNATNQYGQKISSGVYLYRLSIDGKSNTSKLIFLK